VAHPADNMAVVAWERVRASTRDKQNGPTRLVDRTRCLWSGVILKRRDSDQNRAFPSYNDSLGGESEQNWPDGAKRTSKRTAQRTFLLPTAMGTPAKAEPRSSYLESTVRSLKF
jgi:hypothetical protein